jgi:hypothetical protein
MERLVGRKVSGRGEEGVVVGRRWDGGGGGSARALVGNADGARWLIRGWRGDLLQTTSADDVTR